AGRPRMRKCMAGPPSVLRDKWAERARRTTRFLRRRAISDLDLSLRNHVGDTFGAHVEDEQTRRLRAGIGAEMWDVHRLHERLPLMIGARAAAAVVYRDLTVEDVSKQWR